MTELTVLQKKVIDELAQSPLKETFYWTGGTLLAVVYLHHRRSQDLDFFSDSAFSHDQIIGFVNDLKSKLGLADIEEKKIYDRWEFFIHNEEEVRLEFVHYDHPKINPRELWNGIFVDSLDDIAANKVMAMFDRNEPKDVFDLYFLLTKVGYSPGALLNLVEKKFGVRFSESSLWSEAFRKGKTLEDLRPLILTGTESEQEVLLADIRNYYKAEVKKFLDNVLE